MIKSGADVNAGDEDGTTPLISAKYDESVYNVLIKADTKANIVSKLCGWHCRRGIKSLMDDGSWFYLICLIPSAFITPLLYPFIKKKSFIVALSVYPLS